MNYLDKTTSAMRDEILTALDSFLNDGISEIDKDTILFGRTNQYIDKVLRDNLLTSFKNGLEAARPKKNPTERK
jgi:hypothetical protein